tara:strand:+ start:454 stop:1227 length:774 start_codon:yes stop_codon:yes gene_type:complete
MIKKSKPLILVVNDDGFFSPGIKFLISVMNQLGDVYVVAPNSNRSGLSHAMTLDKDIYIEKIDSVLNHFICSGTPVDCVKIAINKILPRLPDLCVSGVNHGSNHSINALYSGTLHGAMEGTIKGIPSISFSHLSYSYNVDLSPFNKIVNDLVVKILKNGLPFGLTLNVNFPSIPFPAVKGIRICKQAKGYWSEEFKLTMKDDSKEYYNISGSFEHDAKDLDTDAWALENNYISIVPISIDSSALNNFNQLNYLQYDF